MEKFFDKAGIALCPHCHEAIDVSAARTQTALKVAQIKCERCNQFLDWWNVIIHNLRKNFMMSWALSPVGARITSGLFFLEPDTLYTFDLTALDIPANAKILRISYTPQGGSLFPVEIHGNTSYPKIVSPKIHIWPRPIKHPPERTEVAVSVVWVDHSEDDYSWKNLVEAFEYFSLKDYAKCVIPANVAVESRLNHLMFSHYTKTASEDQVTDMLSRGASYSHQLNVLLPSVADEFNIPALPAQVRGYLNRLRKLRNQIAHKGKLEKNLDLGSAADLVCAALFGFAYLKNVEFAKLLDFRREGGDRKTS